MQIQTIRDARGAWGRSSNMSSRSSCLQYNIWLEVMILLWCGPAAIRDIRSIDPDGTRVTNTGGTSGGVL